MSILAVLLDVDGTLYYQARLRALMALELMALPVVQKSCRTAYDSWRALRIFRRVREELRRAGAANIPLETWQYSAAAQRAGCEEAAMARLVEEWLYQRPLKYLQLCKRRGLDRFFAFLHEQNLQVGVFSDYPVVEKLRSLDCEERVSVALCAVEPEINAFKPSPVGFLRACTLWGLRPEEVLYVGDRPEVDAQGAANAGMPCAILAPWASRTRGNSRGQDFPGCTDKQESAGQSGGGMVATPAAQTYRMFTSFERLQHALAERS